MYVCSCEARVANLLLMDVEMGDAGVAATWDSACVSVRFANFNDGLHDMGHGIHVS